MNVNTLPEKESAMHAMIFLADYASTSSDGKLNVLGVFDQVNAPAFPARHPQLYIVARLISDIGEKTSQSRHFAIVLLNADSEEVGRMEGEFHFPEPVRGVRPETNIIAQIRDLVFPEPGAYEFVLLVDGYNIYQRPVTVNLIEQPEE